MERVNGAGNFSGNQSPVIIPWKLRKFCVSKWRLEENGDHFGDLRLKHLGNKLYLPSRYKTNQKEYV